MVSYNARDNEATADDIVQQVALHYRVGNTGSFTNVGAAYIADATTGPSLATLVTPVSVTLPAAADNQSLVQLRIMTTNATGDDEWVGIDDLSVTGTLIPIPTLSIGDATVTEGNSGTVLATFTVTVSPPLTTGDISYDIATADGTAQDDNPPAEDNDYVARSLPAQTILANASTYTFDVTVNGDTAFEANETFFVNLTNITATGPSVPNVGDAQLGYDAFVHVWYCLVAPKGTPQPIIDKLEAVIKKASETKEVRDSYQKIMGLPMDFLGSKEIAAKWEKELVYVREVVKALNLEKK